jgi:hypothetical protein
VSAQEREALRAAHAALGSFIWLGNNLHNSDTDTFREMYMACLSDAVTAYNATAEEGEPAQAVEDVITVWRRDS